VEVVFGEDRWWAQVIAKEKVLKTIR